MKRLILVITAICFILLLMQCSSAKHNNTSLKSRILYRSLKSINFSEKTFTQMLKSPKRNTGIMAPEKFNRKLKVKEREIDGFNMLTVYKAEESIKHIIVLHGGAYVAEAVKGHRKLIEKFALSYNFKVSFIDYPLAPEHNALKTLQVVEKTYRELINTNAGDTIFLMGDSAGGGLALALLQILRTKGDVRMPAKTALVSPWLDISLSNPKIRNYTNTDILLNIKGLTACGKLYAGKLDLKDPLISPIYGNMEGLPEIKIWVSNYELLYPDCVLLNNKLNSAQGSTSSISVKKKMIHDWIVLPIRERDETISEIATFFNNE